MLILRLVLLYCILPTTVLSQQYLTEEECITYALEHNPTVTIAKLKMLKQDKLRHAAIDLPATEVIYTRGNINSAFVDYNWQVTQAFESPTVYAARAKQQKNYLELEKINHQALEKELIKEVKLYYNDLSFLREKLKTVTKLHDLYDFFEVKSREKLEKDTIHLMENIALISKHKSIDLLINDTEKQSEITKTKLQQLLCINRDFYITDTLLKRLDPDTTIALDNNPYAIFSEQQVITAEQNAKIQASRHLPEFLVGYFNQQIDLSDGYDGFMLGANIPLWAGANRSEVQAAKIDVKVKDEEYKLLKINIEKEYIILKKVFEKNKYIIDYYDDEGLVLIDRLYDVSTKQFKGNQIDYVEYLSNMEQGIDMYVQYLTAVHDYNDAIIQMHYLTGQ